MVDRIALSPNERAIIDTTANIVTIINIGGALKVFKEGEDNEIVTLEWGEMFSLGVSQGRFIIVNTSSGLNTIFIVRQFIL